MYLVNWLTVRKGLPEGRAPADTGESDCAELFKWILVVGPMVGPGRAIPARPAVEAVEDSRIVAVVGRLIGFDAFRSSNCYYFL
jgi:hypothetical protein